VSGAVWAIDGIHRVLAASNYPEYLAALAVGGVDRGVVETFVTSLAGLLAIPFKSALAPVFLSAFGALRSLLVAHGSARCRTHGSHPLTYTPHPHPRWTPRTPPHIHTSSPPTLDLPHTPSHTPLIPTHAGPPAHTLTCTPRHVHTLVGFACWALAHGFSLFSRFLPLSPSPRPRVPVHCRALLSTSSISESLLSLLSLPSASEAVRDAAERLLHMVLTVVGTEVPAAGLGTGSLAPTHVNAGDVAVLGDGGASLRAKGCAST
jgi:hypothetical protein